MLKLKIQNTTPSPMTGEGRTEGDQKREEILLFLNFDI